MFRALKDRLWLLPLTLPHWRVFLPLGFLQLSWIVFTFFPGFPLRTNFREYLEKVPWYAWVIVWLLAFWISSLEHALGRKRKFDSVSAKFFKAYLNNLLETGYGLFERSGEKDFYSRINDWQHRVIEALGIGLGHQASERFFQKMDSLHPLSQAYREAQDKRDQGPLLRWLQGHLDELDAIRSSLEDPKLLEEGGEYRPREKGPSSGPSGGPGTPRDPGLPKLPPR
jgi:hypothetical protein